MRLTVTSCLAFFVAAGLATPIWLPPPKTVDLAQTEKPKSPEVADLSDLAKRQNEQSLTAPKKNDTTSEAVHSVVPSTTSAGLMRAQEATDELIKTGKYNADKHDHKVAGRPHKRFYTGECCIFTPLKIKMDDRYWISAPAERIPGFMNAQILTGKARAWLPNGFHLGDPYKHKQKQ
ncbi:MAG: hypothetical protein LQ342_007733 [Letrouitia transgressa]|nr:MAG: hypothetical protein LQ342_007733 [Letrouitia transgressa]